MHIFVYWYQSISFDIHKKGLSWKTAKFSVVWRVPLKHVIFAIFILWSFQLKIEYFKCSVSVVSGNKYALPRNLIKMYSSIFSDLKMKFSRTFETKCICIRRFLRCIYKSMGFFVCCIEIKGFQVNGNWNSAYLVSCKFFPLYFCLPVFIFYNLEYVGFGMVPY